MMMPDVRLLSGETVTLLTPTDGHDEHMDEVRAWVREDVADVLVAPGSTSDVLDSSRPDGTRVAYTLGFPKTFSASLRGCHVIVRGVEHAVIGDPQPNNAANCPTPWWYTAEVEAVHG